VIVGFIGEHKDRFGVEPICRVLSEHGCKIAPSTYYDNLNRQPSKRKLRDRELIGLIEAERENDRFVRLFGPGRCGCTCAAWATTSPGAPWSG
jgi:hypothetical protein